jgi:hypothetical protein
MSFCSSKIKRGFSRFVFYPGGVNVIAERDLAGERLFFYAIIVREFMKKERGSLQRLRFCCLS